MPQNTGKNSALAGEASPLALGKNIPNPLFPNGVSTVLGGTLFEEELPGMEGRCI